MRLINAGTYEEAWREVQRLKESAGGDGPVPMYKIVKSPYAGFTVYAFDPDLYVDHLSDQVIDGVPSLPGFMGQWGAHVE